MSLTDSSNDLNDVKLKKFGNFYLIPFSKIVVDNSLNPREVLLSEGDENYKGFREHIDGLKNSISDIGQETPIIVKENEDGTYLLVDGSCRLKAIRELINEKILDEDHYVKAEVLPVKTSDDTLIKRILTTDTNRPLTKGELMRVIFNLHKVRGWELKKIATVLNKSIITITKYFEQWECATEEVKRQLISGNLSADDLNKMIDNDIPIPLNKEGIESAKEELERKKEEKKLAKEEKDNYHLSLCWFFTVLKEYGYPKIGTKLYDICEDSGWFAAYEQFKSQIKYSKFLYQYGGVDKINNIIDDAVLTNNPIKTYIPGKDTNEDKVVEERTTVRKSDDVDDYIDYDIDHDHQTSNTDFLPESDLTL